MTARVNEPPELKGFTVIRPLGSGGFSDVYLYQQHLPERRVAVKVLLTEGMTAATRAAFVAEANLMAQLSHPYIVKIYGADVSDDGRPYLIMEYLSGRTLAQQYKAQPLSVADALRTGIRLSGAIATAHAAGVLHRDIKPANVLTNDYGWPALTDFGIASALEDEIPSLTTTRAPGSDTGSTTGSQSVGLSIPWSPPEMFEDDPRPDVRSDVFSLAATIYTVLAGHTPFEVPGRANQAVELVARIERGSITPLQRSDVPASLVAVLRKGMATAREDRYANAVEFGRALQGIELALKYSQTPIDVPNLAVAEPDHRDTASDDATRARGVTTVEAQAPVSAPATSAPATSAPARLAPPTPPAVIPAAESVANVPDAGPSLEPTVVRGKATEPVIPTRGGDVPVSAEGTSTRRRGRIVLTSVLIAVATVAAVIVGVVVASTPGDPTNAGPSEAPGGQDESPLLDVVPTPVLVSATPSADGTSIEFTWAHDGAEDGDTYVWERTDGAEAGTRTPTSDPRAVVEGVTPGTTVCVDVWVRRDGELSAEPLSACAP